jgi:NitT/TauT family transport system permease protein
VVHIASSLALFLQASLISILVSLLIVYLSPLPALRPIGIALSKVRYLPLTGITFYSAVLVSDARTMQISVLVVFMSLYFNTSLLAMLKDIPAEEIDHARSLKVYALGGALGQ